MRRLAFVVAAAVLLAAGPATATGQQAEGRRLQASLQAGPLSTPPIGWVQFCAENPAECQMRSPRARQVQLTPAAFAQIARVNIQVNREIEQVSDMDHYGVEEYWTYPVDGKGDCEDLVLEKKRRLVIMGFPREALLITVVRDHNGDGHAVLTVVTDRGDYVLDNFTNEVKLWHATGYRFVKRQAPTDPNQWLSLNGGGADPALVAMPRR